MENREQSALWEKAIAWTINNYAYVAVMDGHSMPYPYGTFPQLILAAQHPLPDFQEKHTFMSIKNGLGSGRFLGGFIGYEVKDQVEDLRTRRSGTSGFPSSCFFEAELIIRPEGTGIAIEGKEAERILTQIRKEEVGDAFIEIDNIRQLCSKDAYLKKVNQIKTRIAEGDVYELNYCIRWEAQAKTFKPAEVYRQLRKLSKMPFGGLFKMQDSYILSASPERFLKLEANKIISQPIKGTARRSPNPEEDRQLKASLQESIKERAEHMMIVDLMRNDLARTARLGTIEVEELFGIYSFPGVHQMISTITAEKSVDSSPADVLEKAFPMGSMTGAPKIMAMKLIDELEITGRGPFSGTFGYIDPQGNFDFNVLIRSLYFHKESQKLFWYAGGAITWDSDPEEEYRECLLKTEILCKTLNISPLK